MRQARCVPWKLAALPSVPADGAAPEEMRRHGDAENLAPGTRRAPAYLGRQAPGDITADGQPGRGGLAMDSARPRLVSRPTSNSPRPGPWLHSGGAASCRLYTFVSLVQRPVGIPGLSFPNAARQALASDVRLLRAGLFVARSCHFEPHKNAPLWHESGTPGTGGANLDPVIDEESCRMRRPGAKEVGPSPGLAGGESSVSKDGDVSVRLDGDVDVRGEANGS